MWYQVFLGEGDDATPTSRPLKELDLLREIASLAKQGVTWEEMDVRAFEVTTNSSQFGLGLAEGAVMISTVCPLSSLVRIGTRRRSTRAATWCRDAHRRPHRVRG